MDAVKTILGNKISNFISCCYITTCHKNLNFNYCVYTYVIGGKMHVICGVVQYVNLTGAAIGYIITTSISVV